jgi:type VI protein secretion system component Hcp
MCYQTGHLIYSQHALTRALKFIIIYVIRKMLHPENNINKTWRYPMTTSNYRTSAMLVFFAVLCSFPLQSLAITQVVACFERPSSLTNIPGDPTLVEITRLRNCIKIEGAELGVESSSAISAGTITLGKPLFNKVTIRKRMDDASPILFLNVVSASRYGEVRLFFIEERGGISMANSIIQLGTVLVTNVETVKESGIVEGEDKGTEKISLLFGEMRVTVGTRSTSWSVITNKADTPGLPPL